MQPRVSRASATARRGATLGLKPENHSTPTGLRLSSFVLLLTLFAVCFSPIHALAQGSNDTAFTVGTTYEDSATGEDWLYLLWQSSDPELLRGRSFAVHEKELGDDPIELENRIDALFEGLIPANGVLTLGEKLSLVIQGVLDDETLYRDLLFTGRVHPGINLCLGLAYTRQVERGIIYTYEIREFDPEQEQDLGVIGRITVTAGQPVVLPAPGKAVEVVVKDGAGKPAPWGI